MSLLTFLILKISISKIEVVAMISCFVAVVIAATSKSSSVEGTPADEASANGSVDDVTEQNGSSQSMSPDKRVIGIMFALMAATMNASVSVMINKLKQVDCNVQICQIGLVGCLFSLANTLF